MKFFIISDSIIAVAPLIGAKGDMKETQENKIKYFREFISTVSSVQAQLALNKYWVRGGVSYGELFVDAEKHLIAGPALVKAYSLESQIAKYPRIIVDPAIATYCECEFMQDFIEKINGGGAIDFFNNDNPLKDYKSILFDWKILDQVFLPFERDTHLFVDYVGGLANEVNSTTVENIAKNIVSELYNLEHYKKFNWLKQYVQVITAIRLNFQKNSNVLNPVRRYLQNC